MYQGAYAFNPYGINGDDTIRFNGYYGIARIGTTNKNIRDNLAFI